MADSTYCVFRLNTAAPAAPRWRTCVTRHRGVGCARGPTVVPLWCVHGTVCRVDVDAACRPPVTPLCERKTMCTHGLET